MKQYFIQSKRILGLFILSFAFIFTSCESESISEDLTTADLSANASPAATKGEESIGIIATDNGNFTQLLAALDYVGLTDMFVNGTDQYTVFAPTDEAFSALYDQLEISGIEDLPADLVKDVLLYHVTDGRRFSNSVLPKKNHKEIETLLGASFYVDSNGNIDTNDEDDVTNATIDLELANISASNGVIHAINAVLLPSE